MWYQKIGNTLTKGKDNLSFWFYSIIGNMKNPESTFGKLIDKQKICYLGSIGTDGFPNIKAMLSPRKRNGIKEFFLSTNTSSQKVKAFQKDPKACLYFCDKRFYRGLMLKGTIEILQDQDSKTMLWEKGDTMYYSEGVTDPDYCVLKFTATAARYYQNFKSLDFTIDDSSVEPIEHIQPSKHLKASDHSEAQPEE